MTTGFGQDQAEALGLDKDDSDDNNNNNNKKNKDNKDKNDNVCFSAGLTKLTFPQTIAKIDHAQSLLDVKRNELSHRSPCGVRLVRIVGATWACQEPFVQRNLETPLVFTLATGVNQRCLKHMKHGTRFEVKTRQLKTKRSKLTRILMIL